MTYAQVEEKASALARAAAHEEAASRLVALILGAGLTGRTEFSDQEWNGVMERLPSSTQDELVERAQAVAAQAIAQTAVAAILLADRLRLDPDEIHPAPWASWPSWPTPSSAPARS
jgi:hypothetical protein